MSKKILFCTNAFQNVTNGPAKFAQILASSELQDAEIRILTEDTDILGSERIYKLSLNIPRWLRPFGQFIRMWKYYRASVVIYRSYNFDAVVYNNALVGLLSLLLSNKTFGMVNDYSNAKVSLKNVLLRKERVSKRLIFRYFEKAFCRLSSNKIIVNSCYLRDTLSKEYGIISCKFSVLYKGIEENLIDQDRCRLVSTKEKGSILFVKTDFMLGGLDSLIDAVREINENLIIRVVGPSPSELVTLRDSVRDCSNIILELHGSLEPKKVADYMKRSEIFCVPSRKEAFGVANIEALASGCKVISTNVGGIPEAIGQSKLVWLIEPGNQLDLQNSIREALAYSIKSEDIHSVDSYIKRFSSEEVVINFLTNF